MNITSRGALPFVGFAVIPGRGAAASFAITFTLSTRPQPKLAAPPSDSSTLTNWVPAGVQEAIVALRLDGTTAQLDAFAPVIEAFRG